MNTFFFDDVQYPEGLFGGKDFFNPIIYSTEEREIGVWVDNKPLYEKTIKSTYTKGSSWATITHNISDIENIVNCEAFVVDQGTMYEVPQYRNSSMYFIVGVNSSVVYYINTWLDSGGDISITLRYTKTTDVAGSGQYTTLGIPAHHYDGNEKIVGTWYGETLYEKTINTTVTPPYSSIDLSSLNIGEVVGFEGCSKSSGGDCIPFGYSVASGNQYLVASFEKATSILYISLGSGLSTYNNVFITIRYTKIS